MDAEAPDTETTVRQRWRARIRAWASSEPMPISEADEDELHTLYGFAYCSESDPDVCWFGDPHFSQHMRVTSG